MIRAHKLSIVEINTKINGLTVLIFRINGPFTGIKVEEPMFQSRSNQSSINHARCFN